jgi:hypothetical protein
MKSREFNIKTANLDLDYDNDITLDLIAEYLQEYFDVPQEFIESLQIKNDSVKIKLAQTRSYFNDDWYVNLQRVS